MEAGTETFSWSTQENEYGDYFIIRAYFPFSKNIQRVMDVFFMQTALRQ
jgi:hypothetical protein